MRITAVDAVVLRAEPAVGAWSRNWGKDYVSYAYQTADVTARYPRRWRMRHMHPPTVDTCLVRVTTDEGLVGYGESKGVIAAEMVETYIERWLAPVLIGQDPFATGLLWDRLRAFMRGRGHLQGFHQEAAAGIDIACWDIIGKATGRPVVDLLGGRYTDTVPVYYSSVRGIDDPSDAAQTANLSARADQVVKEGYRAIKIQLGAGLDADLLSVDVVRDAVGSDIPIFVDALGAYHYNSALAFAQHLAKRKVGWLEAPLPTDDFEGHIRLSRESPILIANDLLWTIGLVKELVRAGGRLVVQPEVIKVGITETIRIAQLADTFGCGYAPHVSLGSAIQFAATTHVAAAAPNLVISEYWPASPFNGAFQHSPTSLQDGGLVIPSGPGLGIEIDEPGLQALSATQW